MKKCVDVSNLKEDFANKVCDLYNKEEFFIKSCKKSTSKFSPDHILRELSLQIFFEENNKVVLGGYTVPFCDPNKSRKIKLTELTIEQPDITINNNSYIIQQETWEQTDW
jgi:hypothetical protein